MRGESGGAVGSRSSGRSDKTAFFGKRRGVMQEQGAVDPAALKEASERRAKLAEAESNTKKRRPHSNSIGSAEIGFAFAPPASQDGPRVFTDPAEGAEKLNGNFCGL